MCKIQLICSLLITICLQCGFARDPETVTIDGRTCYRDNCETCETRSCCKTKTWATLTPVAIIPNKNDKTFSVDILFNTTDEWIIYRRFERNQSINYLTFTVTPSYPHITTQFGVQTRYYVALRPESPEDTPSPRCDLKLVIAFVDDHSVDGIPLSEFARRSCVVVHPVTCLNEPSLPVKHNDIQYDPASGVRTIQYSGDTTLECGGPLKENDYSWYSLSHDRGIETISTASSVHITKSMNGTNILCEEIALCLDFPDIENCTLARSEIYTLQLVAEDTCRPTPTEVRWGKACAGQLIFEDNFDSIDEDVWQVEQHARTDRPDHPFSSCQRGAVSAAGGHLRVAPRPQQAAPGYDAGAITAGSLDLRDGCTAAAEACFARAHGADILPPVASGRLTGKGFAFKYGTVEVRAKLPRGDWLYPEIMLEPFMKRYGSWNQASGALTVASARGNEVLYSESTDYSNKVLYGGPIVDSRCREALLSRHVSPDGSAWGERFHVFSLRWTPDEVTMSVDGAEWGGVQPRGGGLRALLPPPCSNTSGAAHAPPPHNPKMAPFDEYFYVTLGVAVGGVTEFPDGVLTTDGHRKPWRNQGRKAALDFWRDMNSWLPTWNQSELIVDYIRIRAL